MELKEAIARAKIYVADVFADEHISGIGLEEVQFDEQQNRWDVTIGFYRPATTTYDLLGGQRSRIYKAVTIADGTGKMLSIRNRDVAA